MGGKSEHQRLRINIMINTGEFEGSIGSHKDRNKNLRVNKQIEKKAEQTRVETIRNPMEKR